VDDAVLIGDQWSTPALLTVWTTTPVPKEGQKTSYKKHAAQENKKAASVKEKKTKRGDIEPRTSSRLDRRM
jgi:hypothetical protein